MAGLAKPNVEGLGQEVQVEIIDWALKAGTKPEGLFDGECVNEWNTNKVAYWDIATAFVQVKIPNMVNMWRSGTTNWAGNSSPFIIYRIETDGTEVDITTEINEITSSITNLEWEKTISNLPAGEYKFKRGSASRIDSEWYFELSGSIEEKPDPIKLSIYKTLKQNLPLEVKSDKKSEIHFTEDGGIYISGNNGLLKQCNAGEIIKEISNPLTTSPLEYGYFTMGQTQQNVEANSKINFDTCNGNMFINDNEITLKKGVTYELMGGIHTAHKSQGNSSIYIKDKITNTIIVNASLTPVIGQVTVSAQPLLHTFYTPQENTSIYMSTDSNTISTVYETHSFLSVKEIRNNPVNQYGGFESQVLFDGNANAIGEYALTGNIDDYDFIFMDFGIITGSGTNVAGDTKLHDVNKIYNRSFRWTDVFVNTGTMSRQLSYEFPDKNKFKITAIQVDGYLMSIYSVIGIKGQLPSLLSGGTF